MIDLKLLRKNFDEYKVKILKKDPKFPIQDLIDLDEKRIQKKIFLDDLLFQSNAIALSGKSGNISEEHKTKAREIQREIEKIKIEYNELEEKFNFLYLRCPNIPNDLIPFGNKEHNKIVSIFGEKPLFDFTPKTHVDLLEHKHIVDFKRGAKIAKSGFVFYHTIAAQFIYRLTHIFLKHNQSFGFNMVLPPYVISKEGLTAASNLPRFEEDVFTLPEDNLYLVPTAEVAINYIHAEEILLEEHLPLRYTAWTPCFRREAGGYGSNERGLMRIHQFEKVEIFSFATAEKSYQEQDYMIKCAESILQKFKLHYHISLLAAEDCSFASARTFDIEVWLPGQNQYREISSISNCTDFQSRRSKTRYKDNAQKTSLVHTLNGSCFAIPRLLIALFETYQDRNGNILLDEIDKLLLSIEKTL
jgi:seryl-tRNA synthetase